MSCTSIKGQVLADLVIEFAEPPLEEVAVTQNMDEKSVGTISLQELLFCKVYVDGVANQRGSGVGLVLIFPKQITIEKSVRLGFSTTNNEAEYEALLEEMFMAQRMGGKAVKMFSNSRLVVGQVKGELEAKDERMQGYLSQVRHLQSRFESFSLLHIPRSGNTHANSLATLATSSTQSLPRVILIEDLCKPTEVKGKEVHVHQVRVGPSWLDPIVLFLREDILPKDKSEVDKYGEMRLVSSYTRTKNFTSALFLGHIYSAFTLRHQNYSLKSYIKGFVETIQEADLCLTEPSLRAIGGQICRKKRKNM